MGMSSDVQLARDCFVENDGYIVFRRITSHIYCCTIFYYKATCNVQFASEKEQYHVILLTLCFMCPLITVTSVRGRNACYLSLVFFYM